jgi:beta-glucosidase
VKRILEYVFKTPTFAQYQYSDKPNLTEHAAVTEVQQRKE